MPEEHDHRLDDVDSRLRTVEQAVVELSVMSRYMRYCVLILAAGLGYDVSGLIL